MNACLLAHFHVLTGFRIVRLARRSSPHTESAKTSNFYSASLTKMALNFQ